MRIGEYAPGGLIDATRMSHTKQEVAVGNVGDLTDFAEFRTEISVLTSLGIGKPTIAGAMELARRNGTSIEEELLSSGWVKAENYYAGLARMLGLEFLDAIDADIVHDDDTLDSQLVNPKLIRLYSLPESRHAIIPQARQLVGLKERLDARPDLRSQMVITTPDAMRAAIWKRGEKRRVKQSTDTLFEQSPDMSARIVLLGKQGFFAGVGLTTIVIAMFFSSSVVFALHAFISAFYLAAMLIRFTALVNPGRRFSIRSTDEKTLPIYTVMVALYKEAAVAEQLVTSLKRLNWPASRLDIKLVCEADDLATIEALRRQDLGPQFEIVSVPAAAPRTKPKALNYALSSARGDLVAVYDAEDRPHPDQLIEAYATFAESPDDVVCLQAPLIIANGRDSWISAIFALEYSALFRMLLPMLARLRLPMPLGGTSNHFKTAVLKRTGGWDPYNVTEDADLGMRLYRSGYRCGVLSCYTLEDAPSTRKTWLHQRTRWFKGWLQTWLVLMRDPRRLSSEMGLAGFAVFQLLVAGMLLSALAHPWLFVFLATAVFDIFEANSTRSLAQSVLFAVDLCNVFTSYILFVFLGRARMTAWERRALGRRWVGMPLYWLMLSVAAWRAVLQLRTNPFFWDKTPHTPSRKPA